MALLSRSLLRKRPAALQVLESRDYRLYWLTRGFSDLGLNLWFLAAAWLTLELTDSQAWVGLVGGVAAIPALAVSLYAGALSDRLDRRRIIIRTQTALVVITGVIAALVLADGIEPWHLLIGALAIGLADGFGNPSYGAYVVDLVGVERIFAANSMAQFANFSGEIVGPLVVGLLIVAIGIGSVFVTALGAGAIALLILIQISARLDVSGSNDEVEVREGVFSDIRAGLRYTRSTPGLLPILIVAASGLFAAAILPLIPIYARKVLGVGGSGFGVLMIALGVGLLSGSLLGAASGNLPRKGLALLMLALVWDAGMIGFTFS